MGRRRLIMTLGVVGLVLAAGLAALIATHDAGEPGRAIRTVCDEVIDPGAELAPGVTAGDYCAQIDLHQDLSLLGPDGFFGRFPHSVLEVGNPSFLRWDTDGCSAPVIGGGPYDFDHPCHRHDFNWRNLKDLDREAAPVWNARTKTRADVGFLADMFSECALRTPYARVGCETTARIYYTVVHLSPGGLGVMAAFE